MTYATTNYECNKCRKKNIKNKLNKRRWTV